MFDNDDRNGKTMLFPYLHTKNLENSPLTFSSSSSISAYKKTTNLSSSSFSVSQLRLLLELELELKLGVKVFASRIVIDLDEEFDYFFLYYSTNSF